jgi:hypothetical protein
VLQLAHIFVSIQCLERAIQINRYWQRRAEWQVWQGKPWRLISAGQALVCPLIVIMLLSGGCKRSHPLQISTPYDLQTFLVVGPLVAFHKGIQVWSLRWTDDHLDPQAQPEAQQR